MTNKVGPVTHTSDQLKAQRKPAGTHAWHLARGRCKVRSCYTASLKGLTLQRETPFSPELAPTPETLAKCPVHVSGVRSRRGASQQGSQSALTDKLPN